MNAALRILSVACLVGLLSAAPDRGDYRAFAWSLALSHYGIAVLYSRARISALAGAWTGRAWLAGLGLATAVLWESQFSLALYFAVHHVLNEVYMLDRVTRRRDDERVRRLRGAGLLLHGLLYAVVLRHPLGLAALPEATLLSALAVGYAVYGLALHAARPALSRRELAEHAVFEVFALVLVHASFSYRVTVLDVATYHVLYWVFFPAFSLARRGAGGIGRYVAVTVVVAGLLYLFSPAGFVEPHFSERSYRAAFVFFSYLHITLSFALSDANPRFVTARFAGRRAVAPA